MTKEQLRAYFLICNEEDQDDERTWFESNKTTVTLYKGCWVQKVDFDRDSVIVLDNGIEVEEEGVNYKNFRIFKEVK